MSNHTDHKRIIYGATLALLQEDYAGAQELLNGVPIEARDELLVTALAALGGAWNYLAQIEGVPVEAVGQRMALRAAQE